MRVLITGGAGFIGSALARAHLQRGDEVTVVDNLVAGRRELVPEGARFRRLDIASPELEDVFAAGGPFDVVSHHAALKDVRRALVDPKPDAEANIVGTLNVLRLAAAHGTGRFVFPSSAAIYGDPTTFPTPETAPIAPISPYGISKAAAELYCGFFARTIGLPAVALRYSTVYGPKASEESEAGSITIFARRLLRGERPTIYGDGQQTRDFVHVDDVVRRLAAAVGTDLTPEYAAAKAGEVRKNVQDAGLIREALGWTPRVSIDEGLAQVARAYRAELAPAGATG